ncbi:MAG TPA: AIR synthase-related protein, partial [Pyrinomonadaceae bacterium]|nr:AIR synthase-related protein [Pyrinomonadaceae bacterium]
CLRAIRESGAVKGLAHITGGGLLDNLPRILPESCDAVIDTKTWTVPAIFRAIESGGNVPREEMYQVFNMGIGMVAIVSADKADAILKFICAQKHDAWLIGEVVKGSGEAKVI